jgi:hypothetical protein
MTELEPTISDLGASSVFGDELSVDQVAETNIEETAGRLYEGPMTPTRADPSNSASSVQAETVESLINGQAAEAPPTPTRSPTTEPADRVGRAVPAAVRKRTVSGHYVGQQYAWQLTVRVDVDGRRPMKRVSGDFHATSGSTTSYYGSFVVHAPTLWVTASYVIIQGLGDFTFNAGAPKVRVIIPRRAYSQPNAPASVQFLTTNNRKGALYNCDFASSSFRHVQLEQDYVEDVTPFTSYDTSLLPSGDPGRVLTVQSAYTEAGIQLQTAGAWNEIPLSGAGSNATWSNAELHQAMELQFSLWQDDPQWKVWLLAAQQHDYGTGLYGIMFDQQGQQRQGCAVFHAGVGGDTPEQQRLQLYTYVHELGHCFNLFHSFHKQYMNPPQPNRLKALSWMNYPWGYPGGAAAFWNAFPFQFDDQEVVHLRHAFRDDIILGGNPFGTGAALENPRAFADPVDDRSGLKLELETPQQSYAYGEPVRIEIKLRLTDMRGKRVNDNLDPNQGFVKIAIQQPSGDVELYEPLMEQCAVGNSIRLDPEERPSIYESVYIGYGKDGFYFERPGFYNIRAAYHAPDGSIIISDTIRIRVRTPISATEEEIADLLFGDEQGTLFYLNGSDSQFLERGNEAFETVLDKYAKHPAATHVRLAKGINEARAFKSFTESRTLRARKPRLEESMSLLSTVIDASKGEQDLDNITLNRTMRRFAKAQHQAGDEKGAKKTLDDMVKVFEKKKLKPTVLSIIKQQAKETRDALK